MQIAITERLVWEVRDDADLAEIRAVYLRTYARKIGEPLRVLNGDTWTLLRVEDVEIQKIVSGITR